MSIEPECYPDTNVYVNLLDISDRKTLDEVERGITILNAQRLEQNSGRIFDLGAEVDFSLAHLKAIHKYLFQEIFEWAGELRSFDLRKGIDIFCPHTEIDYYAEEIRKEIVSDNYLHNVEDEFVPKKLARYIGLLNKLHPFPDGNGRSQRIFVSHLAKQAGFQINWSTVSPHENAYTHQAAHRNNNYSGLEQVMQRIVSKAE